jgi:putative redox protein
MPSVTVSSLPGQPYRQQLQARQHTFYADVPVSLGGGDTAPTPHEYLLGALGACTAITMEMYAKRKNWDLQALNIQVSEDTVPVPNQPGRTMPRIHKAIRVQGALDSTQLETLKGIGEKCPVNKLILGDKQVTSTLNRIA